MAEVLFQKTITNPLADHTEWETHERLVVGVHSKYTFNGIRVEGLIQIIQPECAEIPEDFRDLDMYGAVETTAEGARRLAALLLEAADAVEKAGA